MQTTISFTFGSRKCYHFRLVGGAIWEISVDTTSVKVKRSMIRWFQTPFYPALIALFIPLNLLVQNYWSFRVTDTIRSIAAFVLMSALIFIGTETLFRRRDVAALSTSLFLIGLWIYPLGRTAYIWFAISVLLIGFIVYRRPISPKATAVLNIMGLVLILHLAVTITLIEIRYAEQKPGYVEYSPFYEQPLDPAKIAGPLPSIIHIVLDGYANNVVLNQIMNFDNTPFINALTDLGFLIAEDARAPYNQTYLTMGSIFIGDYLKIDRLPMTIGDNDVLRLKLQNVISHGPVHQQLKRLGYKFLATKNSAIVSRFSDETALSAPSFSLFELNFFEIHLVQNTALQIPNRFFSITDDGARPRWILPGRLRRTARSWGSIHRPRCWRSRKPRPKVASECGSSKQMPRCSHSIRPHSTPLSRGLG